MRINAIQLEWFRGAADPVSLDLACKSMVVYGVNGSGKSSFIDAIEYALNGKIRHLAHEYSGKQQGKAVLNTHRPEGRKTEIRIVFRDGSEHRTEINKDGTSSTSGAEAVAIGMWDYRQTVLRQDEVSEFIHDTKGRKYSTLLPLFGLHEMEVAAENLRRLAPSVAQTSKLQETKGALQVVNGRRKEVFGAVLDEDIVQTIASLHSKYCAGKPSTMDALAQCEELEAALEQRMTELSAEQRRHLVLQEVAKLDLKGEVEAVRAANTELAGVVEPLILEKLEVLQATKGFVAKLGDETEVNCPACGQPIRVEAFHEHVSAESERLQEIITKFEARKTSIGLMCDTLTSLKTNLSKAEGKSWLNELTEEYVADSVGYLNGLNVGMLRTSCGEEDLGCIESKLLPLIQAAASASKDVPPDIQQLSQDKTRVEVGKLVIKAKDQAITVTRAEALMVFITSLEQGVRQAIRSQSQAVIDEISEDILSMWAILHPSEAIETVRLFLPEDADKAIDIGLKFHGVEQDSPKLTLSEGYRNSLGLCIFLALAKRQADRDRPLFLDDVVVSFDRGHRGMIVELLEKEFQGRQVVILTHDREWYTELRQQLDENRWSSKALLPYETPDIGIRWSHKTTTFDDARAQLADRSDSAGNDARKIMDVELALIAERLQIRLPYLRADRNDRRSAHEFLERLVADGQKCFQRRMDGKYVAHSEAIEAFDDADRLVISWANRGSHTFDIVHPEATKLIDACERALECFKCPSCRKAVWFADASGSEWVQCRCGELRWRYGKG